MTKCAKFHISLYYLHLLFVEESIELPSVTTWLDQIKDEKDVVMGGKGRDITRGLRVCWAYGRGMHWEEKRAGL